jgi:membrane peptidoglycan carboxypeptidase
VNTQKYANIDNLSKGGYTVITTYNRAMMDDSIQAANTGFWNAGDWKPTNTKHLSDKDVHLAFASVNPLNGFVESFYNGVDGVEDYTKYPFNAALDGGIQVGSTFKPITLATALDSGQFSLDSTEPGSNSKPLYVKPGSTNPKDKLTYVDQYGKTQNWPPNEDDESGGVNGMATLTQGMAMSLNSVFAALEMDPTIGPDKVLTKAKQMGINADPADFKAVPSLTLGVSSVTPMRMASAYSTFAANGVHREPIQVQKILDSTGKTVWTPPAVANQSITQAMQTNTAAGVTQALQEVLKTGTASQNPAASKFAAKVNYNVAGKTGTTDYNHSAWFNGFSSNLATAVAMYRQTPSGILESLKGVGSSDTTARVNGNSYPTSVWAAFMALEASRHPNLFAKPFPAYTPNCTGVSALTNLGQPVAAGPPAPSSAASGAQYQNYPGSTGPTCQGVLPPTPTTTTTTTTSAPPPPPPPTTPDCQRDPNNLACVSTPSAPTDTPSMPTPSDTLTTPSTTPSGVATTPGSRYCKQNPFAPSCATTSPSSSQTSPLSTP